MNKKELTEIKRNLTATSPFLTLKKVSTAYVDRNHKVTDIVTRSYPLIPEDEAEIYLSAIQSMYSGKLGKNLTELTMYPSMSTYNGTHDILLDCLTSRGDDFRILFSDLAEEIAKNVNYMLGYTIIMLNGKYERPEKDSERPNCYDFIAVALCPNETGSTSLVYDSKAKAIIKHKDDYIYISPTPIDGFIYPAFSDRAPDYDSIITYAKNPAKADRGLIERVLGCNTPMPVQKQQLAYQDILKAAFGEDLSIAIIASVNDILRGWADIHSDDTNLPSLNRDALEGVFEALSVDDERRENALAVLDTSIGDGDENGIILSNILSNKITIDVTGVSISADPQFTPYLNPNITGGSPTLTIPLNGAAIEVNGIKVSLIGNEGDGDNNESQL